MREIRGYELSADEIKTLRKAKAIVDELNKGDYIPGINSLAVAFADISINLSNCGRFIAYVDKD